MKPDVRPRWFKLEENRILLSDDPLISRQKNEIIPSLNIGLVKVPLQIRQRLNLIDQKNEATEFVTSFLGLIMIIAVWQHLTVLHSLWRIHSLIPKPSFHSQRNQADTNSTARSNPGIRIPR